MKKMPFVPLQGVDNVELFYDLIFVYCISVLTELLHHPHDGFLDWGLYAVYTVSFLVVLQVWMHTTVLMNRYGTKSRGDYACLLINMFLLYFIATGISEEWASTAFTFDAAWACILVNLIAHWGLKLVRFEGLDDDDRAIIKRSISVLAVQLAFVVAAAFVHGGAGGWMSAVALAVGFAAFFQRKVYRRKPARFAHIAERCVLLVIVTFGETVVALAGYVTTGTPLLNSLLAFALVAGLFLIYDYEYDNLLDHHSETDGMGYLALNAWIVLVLGNLTVALEMLYNDGFDAGAKGAYFTVCLALYLLTSFLISRYNKPQFRLSAPFVVARLAAFAAVVVIALASGFDPLATLVGNTLVVYAVLGHEMFLYRGRTAVIGKMHDMGYTLDDALDAGYTFETSEGRRAIRDAARDYASQRREGSEGR